MIATIKVTVPGPDESAEVSWEQVRAYLRAKGWVHGPTHGGRERWDLHNRMACVLFYVDAPGRTIEPRVLTTEDVEELLAIRKRPAATPGCSAVDRVGDATPGADEEHERFVDGLICEAEAGRTKRKIAPSGNTA